MRSPPQTFPGVPDPVSAAGQTPQAWAQTWQFRRRALAGLIIAFAIAGASVVQLLFRQPAGSDFLCFWAGGQAALHDVRRLYDFAYVTGLQGWPQGSAVLRAYINPPSALLVFAPASVLPYWIDYGLWVLLTGALFLAAGRRIGAPWWFILLPPVMFAAYCGQLTFLIGALAVAALALGERRILAGVLFGVAAAIKPQLLILLPVALIAQGRWLTILSTAVTGLALVALSAVIWGLQPWLDWFPALSRIWSLNFGNPQLVAHMVSPYAVLTAHGLSGRWTYLLIPPVLAAVWLAFRRDASTIDRSVALLGGALLLSPYAMNYELALLAPAVAAYVARIEDRRWPGYVLMSVVYIGAPASLALWGPLAMIAIRLWPSGRGAVDSLSLARLESARSTAG